MTPSSIDHAQQPAPVVTEQQEGPYLVVVRTPDERTGPSGEQSHVEFVSRRAFVTLDGDDGARRFVFDTAVDLGIAAAEAGHAWAPGSAADHVSAIDRLTAEGARSARSRMGLSSRWRRRRRPISCSRSPA